VTEQDEVTLEPEEVIDWPMPLVLATLVYILLGLLAMFILWGDPAKTEGWAYFICLVIGIGLWTRQNWARWMGIVYNVLFFLAIIKKSFEPGMALDASKLILCVVALALIFILFKHSFQDQVPESTNPESMLDASE